MSPGMPPRVAWKQNHLFISTSDSLDVMKGAGGARIVRVHTAVPQHELRLIAVSQVVGCLQVSIQLSAPSAWLPDARSIVANACRRLCVRHVRTRRIVCPQDLEQATSASLEEGDKPPAGGAPLLFPSVAPDEELVDA